MCKVTNKWTNKDATFSVPLPKNFTKLDKKNENHGNDRYLVNTHIRTNTAAITLFFNI